MVNRRDTPHYDTREDDVGDKAYYLGNLIVYIRDVLRFDKEIIRDCDVID
jgi:hypothetical protein